VHVHGKCQGREAKAELLILNGLVFDIRYHNAPGRPPLGTVQEQPTAAPQLYLNRPLAPREMQLFREIVTARADAIVAKWIDYFVLHKPITAEHITRRLK